MRRRRGIARETDEQIKRRIGLSLWYRWRFTGRRPDGTMDPAFKPFDPPSRPRAPLAHELARRGWSTDGPSQLAVLAGIEITQCSSLLQ
jgi:hypothetical protein